MKYQNSLGVPENTYRCETRGMCYTHLEKKMEWSLNLSEKKMYINALLSLHLSSEKVYMYIYFNHACDMFHRSRYSEIFGIAKQSIGFGVFACNEETKTIWISAL